MVSCQWWNIALAQRTDAIFRSHPAGQRNLSMPQVGD
jgi:hypothetical protein